VLETERSRGDDVGQLLDTVKAYAKQETLGPLKGVGRSIGLGLAGVICLGLGVVFLLVAVLRVLQTETSAFDGNWSFVPYVIDLVLAIVIVVLALSRIKKVDLPAAEEKS
jgi:Putative Actinobacterial Holin-X, holin superfamily III